MLGYTPLPGADTPLPQKADFSIRSTSGRYASYWNAFLLPPANVVCEGYVFTPVCDSVNRGACMVAWGGMHGCSGGVRGCSGGACVVAPRGACMVAPGGHAWLLQGGVW